MTFRVDVRTDGPFSVGSSGVEVVVYYGNRVVYSATAPASLLAEVMQLAGAAMMRDATGGRP